MYVCMYVCVCEVCACVCVCVCVCARVYIVYIRTYVLIKYSASELSLQAYE